MDRFDAIVIGGGPAGLAAAIASARAGLSVLLTDVRQPPIDRLCGEGILPDGLEALSELGVEVPAGQGAAFAGISFHDGASSFGGAFPGRAGRGLRRTELHNALVAAASREGVAMRWGARAEVEGEGGVRVAKDTVHCRYIVGADGQQSLVRQAMRRAGRQATWFSSGMAELRRGQRLASGRHYAVRPWSRLVEVHWAGRTQAYVTPVGAAEVGVAYLSADPAVRTADCLDLFPVLRERLAGVEVLGKTQGGVSVGLRVPRVVRGNIALIGEASGSVDSITGEGLTLLLRQALALGPALRMGNLAGYERSHRRILRRARVMSRLLLTLSEWPGWRARVFRAFAAEPRAFENLLAVHVGQRPRMFGAGGCAGLCGQVLFG